MKQMTTDLSPNKTSLNFNKVFQFENTNNKYEMNNKIKNQNPENNFTKENEISFLVKINLVQ